MATETLNYHIPINRGNPAGQLHRFSDGQFSLGVIHLIRRRRFGLVAGASSAAAGTRGQHSVILRTTRELARCAVL